MKFLIILIPGLIVSILALIKKEYRILLTLIFVVYVILMNLFYNSKNIGNIVNEKTTVNQLIYQESYKESKEYPDALLPFLVKHKNVYVKNDPVTRAEAREKHFNWAYSYYHMHNASNAFIHMHAFLIPDDSLNNVYIDEAHRNQFENIGYANDMMRNSLMYSNNFGDESGNYFYYYWYYGDQRSEMNMYVNFDGIYEAKELVLLWQLKDPSEETEDFYLMTKEYYEENIK